MKARTTPISTPKATPSPGQTTLAGGEPGFFSTQISSAKRFYLDLHPPGSRRLAVVCGGLEHCDATYHVHRPDFDYYSLEFVARGRGTVQLERRRHTLTPGAVFAYGPHIGHDMRSDPAAPLVKYFVDFTGPAVRQLLTPPGPAPGQLIQTSAPEHILRLFEDLIAAGLRQTPFSPRLCAAILEQLLLRVAETAVPEGTIGSLAFETYQHCRQVIESDHLHCKKLPDLARRCHVSPAYLCRLYERFDHRSPYQHLQQLQMRHAAAQLQTPGALVKQVAAQMGYRDPFQFSRTFRRVIGMSPRQFMTLRGNIE